MRRVWNGSADSKSRQMRGAFRHTISQRKRRTCDILDHPPYSPDLASSDFHLFLRLKKHLAGKMFDEDDEVQEEITWFKGLAADFYDSGIQKLVPRLNKYLGNAGDYFPDTPLTRISKYNSPNIYGSKKWRIKSPVMCVDWCIVVHVFEGCKCEPSWRTTSVTIYQSTWCSIPELESSASWERGASFSRSKKHFLQVVWKQPFHCPSCSSPTVFGMIEL